MLGTDILFFVDEFDDPASGWGTGGTLGATVGYEDGVLAMDITSLEAGFLRTPRSLNAAFQAVRVAVQYEVGAGSSGIYGVHCADAEGDFYGGAVDTDGTYLSYQRIGGVDQSPFVYADSPQPDTGGGHAVVVMVECAVTPAGDVEIYFSINGTLVAHETGTQSALGPLTSVGLYTQSEEGSPMLVKVSEAAAWVGSAPSVPTAQPPAGDLLQHVPAEIASTCIPASALDDPGYVEGVSCNATGPQGSYIAVFYYLYTDPASADAAVEEYSDLFEGGVEEDNGDCTDGEPSAGTWTIGGEPAGRYVCGTYFASPVLAWSYDDLSIVVESTNNDGDFAELWDWWETAGPNP